MTAASLATGRLPPLAWAAASQPLPGEAVSGDLFAVCPFPGGVLLAAVDALGHGPEAAFAAKVAVATLERYSGDPLPALFRRCHEMLTRTRGVVAGLASLCLHTSTLSWASVGNIEGAVLRPEGSEPRESMIQYGGVVGYKLPRLSSLTTVRLGRGDRLVFATDGLRQGFLDSLDERRPLAAMAGDVFGRYFKGTDDGLILLAEYDGADP